MKEIKRPQLRKVLHLMANGYNIADIARILQIAQLTVKSYQSDLRQLLEIKDNAGLIEFAVQYVREGEKA